MKERMQKTLAEVKGCPRKDRTEGYVGAQTFMWICEDNIVEVPFDKEHLLERIISPDNLLKAYKAVQRNKGCGGIDNMSCEQMLPWLLANKEALIRSLLDGSYRPNPVKRVEIPKDNGKMRLLGIPTVIDRLVKCGIAKYQAYMWGNSRLGHWRIAGSYILSRAITNEKLSMAGYATLMGSYIEWHPK